MKQTAIAAALLVIAFGCHKKETAAAGPPSQGRELWLRADSGVTADASGKVSAWDGAPLKATAPKPEQQPTLVQNAIGGKPAVHFDGNDNMLVVPLDINPSVSPQLTVITVFSSDTAAPELRKLYGHDDGGYDRVAGLDSRGGDDNYVVFGGNADVVGIFKLQEKRPYVTVESYDDAKKVLNTWVNGAPAKQNVASEHDKGLKEFYVGGTGTVYHEQWMGNIAEMLVYGRTLTDGERRNVEDYLAAKYGLKLSR